MWSVDMSTQRYNNVTVKQHTTNQQLYNTMKHKQQQYVFK